MKRPSGPWRREVTVVAAALLVSLVILGVLHYAGDPAWVRRNLPPVAGSGSALWQVQTTFLSVGFAGLTIAAQLFAEAPLAIGTSRKRILAYIGASWFVTVGLVANAVMAFESIWLPSATGVILSFAWFVATAALLLVSTSRLTQLFGHPSRLDEVVRSSLVETLSDRVDQVARRYTGATKGVDELLSWDEAPPSFGSAVPTGSTLAVPVPEAGRVVRAIRPKAVRQASGSLGLTAIGRDPSDVGAVEDYAAPRIMLDVRPGDRTRLGDTAFRVVTSSRLDPSTAARVVRLLQSSISVEPREAVTPYEETEREIETLKDAVGTNLRSGALDTAERALELLGHIVRGAWMAELDREVTPRRGSLARGIGLFQTIGEVERDALLSPQVAHVFLTAATVRAVEAPTTCSAEYVDECLRSFTRLWSEILRLGGPEFEEVPARIVACVRDLIAYSVPSAEEPGILGSHGVWALVELVKLALDAGRPDAAAIAVDELRRLSDSGQEGPAPADIRAGLLVLSTWLGYLAETDPRSADRSDLAATVRPRGSWSDIFAARDVIDGGVPFIRWDTWAAGGDGSTLPGFLDRAQLSALVGASGSLPDAEDDETADEYERLLRLLPEASDATGATEARLRRRLEEEVGEWDAGEDERLAREPVSASRVEALAASLRAALGDRGGLAQLLADEPEPPEGEGGTQPVLGLNIAVPRRYFVDTARPTGDTDAEALGRMIAGAFTDAEDRRLVGGLRALGHNRLDPAVQSAREVAALLRSEGEHFILVAPFGGPGEAGRGLPAELTEELGRLTLAETGALDDEVIVFDRRTTLRLHREPERREGLTPVEGTRLALGVFDDVRDRVGSQVRVQVAESLVVAPGRAPRVFRLGIAR
ncbi:MAG: hypothetical protein AAGC66_05680 [Leifsonia sp.]